MDGQHVVNEELKTPLLQANLELLNGLDPQFLYGSAYINDLKSQLRVSLANVDVLDITHFEDGQMGIKMRSFDEVQLRIWLNGITQTSADDTGRKITGGLRLILGRSSPSIPVGNLPATFPETMESAQDDRPLAFSTSMLEKIIDAFNLPSTTPWVFVTDQSHFRRHSVLAKDCIGYTMRRPTWGVLDMNICLSISHSTASGMTYALLHGCSNAQQAFVKEQLRSLASVANHPLLLPILFSAHQRQLLHKDAKRLWDSLLDIETASGQTGVPVVDNYGTSIDSEDYTHITKETLGVIQLASGWQSTLKDIILGIDEIKESLTHLSDRIRAPEAPMVNARDVFSEWLQFTSHQSNVLMGQLEYIDKRAQAQMTAVYSYVAQKDAKYSTELAADSREISAASKRDSSAMKGIALLTMVFLPGTFMATFFAMPIFDFAVSSRPQVREPGFWIYWAVTIPLTFGVLGAYGAYLVWVQRRNREEDRNARFKQPSDRTNQALKGQLPRASGYELFNAVQPPSHHWRAPSRKSMTFR